MSRIILSLSVVLALTASLPAQDDLGRILERDKIAAQKLQGDANYALAQSRVLERKNPAQAAEMLQDALAKVRNASELPAEERARLLQRLQTRLREVTALAQDRARAEEDAAQRAAVKVQQEARDRDPSAAAPRSTTPNQGPASVAGRIIESRNAQLSALDRQKSDRASRNQDALADVQRRAVQMSGVIELPKDWERISERGKPKLTSKEVALLKALNSTLSVNFDKTRLSLVIEQLQDKAGLTILIDESSLKDANVDLYEDTVTFKVSKVTVRTILKKVLADRGLSYVIKEGMVQVVTQQKAREMMVVRAYPINDLVATNDPIFWGPIFNRAFMLQNAQAIINMIQSSVEPSQWNINGGPGSITFHEPSMSLVIRASAEMHFQMAGAGIVSR